MKKVLGSLFLLLAVLVPCRAQLGPSRSPAVANNTRATYHISPSGNDNNTGLLGSPWLTPNHPVNCGDTIIADSGTYSNANFTSGKWAAPTCPSGNAVVWLVCAVFDGCIVNAGSSYGIHIDQSYWGVFGWEVDGTSSSLACLSASPSGSYNIHHIIFMNNVVNGCGGGGVSTFPNGTHSEDYIAVIANVVYNAAQNPVHCFSGLSIYQPIATDNNPGTHIYVAGNISYGNHSPSNCEVVNNPSGTASASDASILDTLDGSQGLSGTWGTPLMYLQQVVLAYNLFFGNGGRAIEYQTYTKASATHPAVYIYNNTTYGNSLDLNTFQTSLLNEVDINIGYGVSITNNILQSTQTKDSNNDYVYAVQVYDGNQTNDAVSGNLLYSVNGTTLAATTESYNDDTVDTTQWFPSSAFSSNTIGVLPGFASPSTLPTIGPSCTGKASTYDCMSNVFTILTPSAPQASGLGYQAPSYLTGTDSLFPKWLCTSNIPLGFVTPKC